jgi:Domain of unknown function (DUF4340)
VRARGTLILLVLFLAALGYVWFVERGKPSDEEREAASRRLLALDAATITSVRLDHGDSLIALARESPAHDWRLVAPIAAPADPAAIETLTALFADLTAERLIPASEMDSVATGLHHPWLVVTVTAGGDSAVHVLRLGDRNPTRSAYYARLDQSADLALLPADAMDGALRKTAGDFRDRHLARFAPEEAARIDFAAIDRELSLRRTDGRWQMAAPRYLADEGAVRGFLSRLTSLEGVELGDAPERRGPAEDPPALLLSVRDARDSLLASLRIGSARPAAPGAESDVGSNVGSDKEPLFPVEALGQPDPLGLDADGFTSLFVGVDDLRDRHLVDLGSSAIDSLTIAASGRMAAAAAADSGTGELAIAIQNLPHLRVAEFADERAQSSAELARYGLVPPRLQIAIRLRNGERREVYFGGEHLATGGIFAHRPGIPGVVVVPRSAVDQLTSALWSAAGQDTLPPASAASP